MRPQRWRPTAVLKLVLVLLGVAVVPHVVNVVERWSWDGEPFSRVRHRVERYLRDTGLPSISVAAAKDGRIVWEESFGWADVERRTAATPRTMYALASTSKAFTATGIMALVERGLLDLDRPVSDYVPDVQLRPYEGDLSDVTLRRIFTHTSGLPQFWCHYYEDELATRPSASDLMDRYGILVSPPGERFIYSNVGIGLARLVIENVSGTSYAEFMQAEVLDPLGLAHTAILTAPYEDAGIAQKYMRGEKLPFGDMGFRAAGSFWASAGDLVRFGMFHLGGRFPDQKAILSERTRAMMFEAVDPRLPDHNRHLPWIEYGHRGYRIMEFGGHVVGGKVSFRLVPSEDVAVVVMSNGDEADTQKISSWVLNHLLPGFRWTGIPGQVWARLGRLGIHAARGTGDLAGPWVGAIRTEEGDIPMRLVIDERGEARLGVGDGNEVTGSGHVSEDTVFATFPASIPTAETARDEHQVILDLRLRGGTLGGPVYAESTRRPVFWLPFYARLTRAE